MSVGDTEVLPEVAPPVEKLSPVQDVAYVEDHERVALCPDEMLVGETETVHSGGGLSTVHDV